MDFIEVIFQTENSSVREQLIGHLSVLGYDGFLEEDAALKGYISAEQFDGQVLSSIANDYQLTYQINTIGSQNWNAVWESNFQPITVDDFVGVRANFHEVIEGVRHELVITPKMSFGTGHHATTWMMMKLMEQISFDGKTVFDFGTGTGILAILAEKLGAADTLAMDYDDWCIENATENIEANGCSRIVLMKGDTANVMQRFQVILANINRHIIEANIAFLAGGLEKGGVILLSGLLGTDENDMLQLLRNNNLRHIGTLSRNGWIAMQCEGIAAP